MFTAAGFTCLGAEIPWSDNEGADGSVNLWPNLPFWKFGAHQSDTAGTNYWIRFRIDKIRLPPRYPIKVSLPALLLRLGFGA